MLNMYMSNVDRIALKRLHALTGFLYSLSSEDFAKKGSSNSRHHMGYPPVTPNAVATDTILSQIFDQLWGEVGEFYKAINIL